MASRKIFLSCASAEYRSLRAELSASLRRADCEVKVQEDFRQAPESTLQKLDEYIRSCAAVIHLVGAKAGSEAAPIEVREYLGQEKDFLERDPELREALGRFSDLSYTQWEAYMALHHEVPLFVYAAEGVVFEEDQQAHRHRLTLSRKGRHVEFFQGDTELLGKLIGDLRHILPEIPLPEATPAKPSNLPHPSLGPLFKGRKMDLERLHAMLNTPDRKVVVLHGMGGVGKTRLAVEYGHRHKEHLSARLFLEADAKISLYRNLADLAKPEILNLPAYTQPDELVRRRAVLEWLGRHPDWLLILNNVDTPEAAAAVEDLLAELPQARGHLLVTSRLRDWSAHFVPMELKILDPDSAFSFLKERTEGRRVVEPGEDHAFRELVRELDGLALALEQAGAYIASREMPASKYLRTFKAEKSKALAWCHARTMRYPHSVAATLKISFDRIGEASRHLLQILACLAPTPIPLALFSAWEEALSELRNFSLTQHASEPQDAFLVHRLVQEVMHHRLEEEGTVGLRHEVALNLLAEGAPDDAFEAWKQWEILTPHIRKVLGRMVGTSNESQAVLGLLNDFANFLKNRFGAYLEAEPLYRRALEARERVLGFEHPETLSSVNNLAGLLERKGDFEEAEPLYHRALEASERVLGPEHRITLTSVNNLASLLNSKGAVKEAEPLYRRTLEARERLLGPEHPQTLTSVNNLAYLLQSKGANKEAEPLYRRAVEASERVLGPEHPNTLTSVNNLAFLLQSKGAFEEAEPLYRQVLAACERVLGPEHPDTLSSVNNLAFLLQSKGAYEEAEPLYRRALTESERVLGPEHPFTLTSVNNLAGLLDSKGAYEEAEPLYRQVLEARELVLGREHPDTLTTVNNLAFLLQSKGAYEEAQPLYQYALEKFEKILPPNHPNLATVRSNWELCKKQSLAIKPPQD